MQHGRNRDPARQSCRVFHLLNQSTSTHFSNGLLDAMRRVQRYVAGRVPDPADAADIAQESLARMMERAREIEIARPDFYALRIARNLINDRHRAAAMRIASLDEQIVCTAPLADQILSDRQRLDAFRAALDAMPPLRREVFIRRRLHQESREDIATALGLEIEAVKKHISRALTQLAQTLAAKEALIDERGWQGDLQQ